jgi:AAA domain
MPKRTGPAVVVTEKVGTPTSESFLDESKGLADDPPWLVPESEVKAQLAKDAVDAHTTPTAAQEEKAAQTDAENLEAAEQVDENLRRQADAEAARGAKKPAARKPRASRAKNPPSTDAQDAAIDAEIPAVAPDEQPSTEIELVPLDDSTDHLSVMYYGVEGTGKSTDALQMTLLPEPGIVVAINAEGGMKKGALTAMGVDTSRVLVYPKPGERVTFDGLERLFFQLATRLGDDPDSVLGVIWDSSTDIVQELLDQVVEDVMATQQAILDRNKGARSGNIKLRDRFDNDRDDYRRMSNQVRSLLRKYRYLPCHFVVTALMRRDEDETTKRVTYGPAVTPALQADLLGYVDMVLHCQVADVADASVYFATSKPTRTHRGKDRLHVLPTELVNPGFDRLTKYVTGELTDETDPDQKALATKPAATPPAALAAKPARTTSGKKAKTLPEAAPPVTGNPDDVPPY